MRNGRPDDGQYRNNSEMVEDTVTRRPEFKIVDEMYVANCGRAPSQLTTFYYLVGTVVLASIRL